MIKRKKKRILIAIIVIAIIAITTIGIAVAVNINKGQKEKNIETENINFKTKALIIKTENEVGDTYNAIYVEEIMENMYVLEYETEEATRKAYEQLKKRKDIEYVTPDQEYEINDINRKIITYQDTNGEILASWGPTAMGLDVLQQKVDLKTNVQNIKIAVLDSGLEIEHPTIVGYFPNVISEKKYNAIDRGTDITDENGHGTMMTGAILDGAPQNIEIIPIKVLDSQGKCNSTTLIRGINYAIEQNVDIMNMSLGTEDESGLGDYTALKEAVQTAINSGIVVVAATGNGGEDDIADNMDPVEFESYPAEVPDVIATGAVKNNLIDIDSNKNILNKFIEYYRPSKENLIITAFSNYGEAVDFVTPGEAVITLYPTNLGGSIAIGDGTSQATAYMTAAISNVLSYNSNFTNEQVYEILEYYAEDLGAEGKDVYYGNGFVNFNNMQECTCGSENCDEIYCFGCTNTECIYHETEEKVLNSIELTTTGVKTEYTEGEKFNPEGLVVTAKYSDESSSEVTNYTYSPSEELTTSDTKITITYTENEITKTEYIDITVKAKPAVEIVLESIELIADAVKKEYTEGEKIDITGLIVIAKYSDGTEKTITNYSSFPTTELTTENNKITIKYTEDGITKTEYIDITVKAKQEEQSPTLSKIELNEDGVKKEYTEGEKFDTTGLIVTAKYSDGSSQIVTDYMYTPQGELTPSDTKIIITYQGKTAEIGITVKARQVTPEKTLDRIELTTNGVKTEYIEGERFDKTGLIVKSVYSDGSSETVTDYTYSPSGELTPSDTKIIITYQGKTAEIGITVKARQLTPEKTLDRIELTTSGVKTEYIEGERFDKTGLIVKSVYSDGSSETVTDYTYSPSGELTPSDTKITITYQGKTAEVGITVKAKQVQNIIVEKDNTIKDGNIANTGLDGIIIPISIISIIVVVAVIGNIKYKDI